MKYFLTALFLLILGLFLGSQFYYLSPLHTSTTNAVAVIHPTKGNTTKGIVRFTKEKGGVRVHAEVENIAPGAHGFHIHAFGDCGCDDAKCAGDHYNPTNMPHAGPEDVKRHIGDLGNIIANEDGIAIYEYLDTHIALNGPDSIIGRAVIVHADSDDFHTQPTGNAGARIGCGVIGIGK